MSNQMWSTQKCTNKSVFSLSFLAIICRCRLGMERGLVGAVSDLDSSAADNPEFSIWSVACTKLGTSSVHQLSSTFPRHPTEPPEPCTGGHGQPQPAGHGHTGHPLTAAMPWRWPALLPAAWEQHRASVGSASRDRVHQNSCSACEDKKHELCTRFWNKPGVKEYPRHDMSQDEKT